MAAPAATDRTVTLLDQMAPGRSADARPPGPAELRSTLVLRFPIAETSAKVRTGPPVDDPHLAAGIPVPGYAADHPRRPR